MHVDRDRGEPRQTITDTVADGVRGASVEERSKRRVATWSEGRVNGMPASDPQHRRDDREPEFGDRWCAFVIAMLMVGAIKPERVVERVVAEVEREAQGVAT